MTLKEYERIKYINHLRNFYIKDCCEICGSQKNLELHHNKSFIKIIMDTLNILGYEYFDNINQYSIQQLNNITDMMIGMQIRNGFTTLCSECHKTIHKNKDEYKYSIKIRQEKEKYKIKILNDNIKKQIIPKLNEIKEKKYYDKEPIHKILMEFNLDAYKVSIINKNLQSIDVPYYIFTQKENHRQSGHRNQRYWQIKEII